MVAPVLTLRDATFGYGGPPILRDVSFSVEPGEIIAVVGPNGVGKSTLIKAVSGILQLSSGSIEIQHSALEPMSPAERARLVSVVPQAALLPGGYTVRDVVLMGRTPYLGWLERESIQDYEIVDRAMGQTEIEELADRLVGELSGGEQQRVLIARALAQDSPVMLLDEPTAHLDLRHQDRLLDLIRRLASDHALGVLAAIHDLNLVARLADRVILLSGGMIKKRGKPADVLTPEELEAVYGIQIHVTTHPIDGGPLVLTG